MERFGNMFLENELISLAEEKFDGCAVLILANTLIDPQTALSFHYSHIREANIISLLYRDIQIDRAKTCKRAVLLYSSVGATPQFADHVIKRVRSLGIEEIITIVMDMALSLGALLPILSDEFYMLPGSVLGTLDPLIFNPPGAPKESVVIRDLINQLMVSMPREGVTGRAQVMHALSVSGLYYEYELASKTMEYIESLLMDKLERLVGEDKASEIIDTLLNKVSIHDQPLSADEVTSLFPHAKFLDDKILESALSKLHMNLVREMDKSSIAVTIASSKKRFQIPLNQHSMPPFRF